MLAVGVDRLVFVPIFKALTGMQPYMGMMRWLPKVWLVSEFIHPGEDFTDERKTCTRPAML